MDRCLASFPRIPAVPAELALNAIDQSALSGPSSKMCTPVRRSAFRSKEDINSQFTVTPMKPAAEAWRVARIALTERTALAGWKIASADTSRSLSSSRSQVCIS